MKIRTDTIAGRIEEHREQERQRQQRIDAALYWVGIAGLTISLAVIISLFIGLGNMAAIIQQIGGGL